MSLSCPYCSVVNSVSEARPRIVGFGFFVRKSDHSRQRRFLCRPCQKTFSLATSSVCVNQKKRHLNPQIFQMLCHGNSQRGLAKLLRINRKTVVRKLVFLGLLSHHILDEYRTCHPLCREIEFDDLETFEHSKLKPLSVIAAVESHSRRILGFRVAQMPAKGLLVKKSLLKYGKRKDERKAKRRELFQEIKACVSATALIKSDENPHYSACVKMSWPECEHLTYKGRRGCVVGQGELKSGGFDPLFSLNHTFAMFRAHVNRLFRRTWNTTKKKERLALHLSLYVLYHNLYLI